MLKLKELRFSGIGRFVEEQVVDFSSLGGLVQVDGLNNNTGGSSGAGKSTIFQALEFLLGINDKPTTVLQSRLTKEKINVTGIFDLDGKEVKVIRAKGKLSVEVDGNLTVGSNEKAEEELDKVLAVPRDVFRKMVHKRQKEGGFFLKFTPKQMYEFLTDALGLSGLADKIDKLDMRVKSLEASKEATSKKLDWTMSALEAKEKALLALGEAPVQEMTRDMVLEIKNKADTSAAVLASLKSAQKQQSDELQAKRPELSKATWDASKRVQAENEIATLNKQLSALREEDLNRVNGLKEQAFALKTEKETLKTVVSSARVAKEEAAKHAADIQTIKDCKCPTCQQDWIAEAAKAKEQELLSKIIQLKDMILAGESAKEKLIEIDTAIGFIAQEIPQSPTLREQEQVEHHKGLLSQVIENDRTEEQSHTNTVHFLNQKKLADFAQFERDLKVVHARDLEVVRTQVDYDRRALEVGIAQMKSFDSAKERYEVLTKGFSNEITENQVKKSEIEQELNKISQEVVMAEEIRKAIKTYASCSFDDALVAIGDTATRIIRNIPNMANATIQLVGTKETKEGKVKEEVNALIHVDGEESVPIKSLSGGEESSLDLAVDLAVLDFVEHKSNKGIDLFILDEPFTGLDTVTIEMALEVLKNANINKRLILVDHNPEVKEMVESRLLVIRDGDTSKVEQAG